MYRMNVSLRANVHVVVLAGEQGQQQDIELAIGGSSHLSSDDTLQFIDWRKQIPSIQNKVRN